MPLDALQTVLTYDSFIAMGTRNTVVVDEAGDLPAAMAIVEAEIHEIDRVCSRFREDSELSELNHTHGRHVAVSAILEEAIIAGLRTAAMTDGLVDLTVGKCVEDAGYTVTFRDLPPDGPPLELRVRRALDWRSLDYNPVTHTVRVPNGMSLDLGASGKAWAADRAAAAVAKQLDVSVAVDCGGDISVRGPHPKGGWPVRVTADVDSGEWQDVMVFDGGLATSGTTGRRWRRGGVEVHHIIDPSTGQPARTPWAMVTVAAATCVEANAAATAALIRGDSALAWLNRFKLPSRLVDVHGGVHFAGGWSV